MSTHAAPNPPLPGEILDLLSAYPNILAELEGALRRALNAPTTQPRFERAIWSLKDTLGDMMVRATEEISAAESRGDGDLSSELKIKRSLIEKSRSSSIGMRDLSVLENYCDILDGRAT